MAQKQLDVEDQSATDILSKYTYCLSLKNDSRGRVFNEHGHPVPDPDYPPRRNLLLRSSIIWPGGKDPFSDKERAAGRYPIRYYDGCTTLFVEDQPKDREVIEQLLKSTRELSFIEGYLAVYGYDTMLKMYMDICSWNEESKYRVPTTEAIFKLLDAEKSRSAEANRLDLVEQALELAREAKEDYMLVHAKFLSVPMIDNVTSQPLTPKAIRTEYRKAAMNDPKKFIETYNDKTMAIKNWIERSLEVGEMSTTLIPNKAVWAKTGVVICDISGLSSKEGILNRLIELSQTKEGAEFKSHLEGLYKK